MRGSDSLADEGTQENPELSDGSLERLDQESEPPNVAQLVHLKTNSRLGRASGRMPKFLIPWLYVAAEIQRILLYSQPSFICAGRSDTVAA